MAEIVKVTDTFSFWREQFNALVGEVGVKKYFKTPQDFGAAGDGLTDDTAAFDSALLQSKPVYIPPGKYYITKNISAVDKFFNFGGVEWVNTFSVTGGFRLDPTTVFVFRKQVEGVDPVSPQHLTTKNYVDIAIENESTARSNTDANLQNQLNLVPTQANWYNNGILRVGGDGGTELGRYVDFHANSTSGDFDVRLYSNKGTDQQRTNWGTIADYTEFGFWSENSTFDPSHGRFPHFHHNLTDGWVQYNIGRVGSSNANLGGFTYRHGGVAPFSPFDWQNDGKGGLQSKEFLSITNHDYGGGAIIRGIQRRNDHSVGLKLQAIRNNASTQTEWLAGAIHLTASRFDRNASPQFQLLGNEENIFTVANNESARLTLKGDGRVVAPNCSVAMILASSTNKVLTTKEYVDNSVLSLANNTYTKTESDSRFVNVTGDTMSGFLSLHANPTQNLHAATKQYVDNSVLSLANNVYSKAESDSRFVNATGDILMNGSFSVGEQSNSIFSVRNSNTSLIENLWTDPYYGLQVDQADQNKDAMMRFAVWGRFAFHLGLDSSKNDIAVGGYSFGANSYRMLHEGNMDLFTANSKKTTTGNWFNDGFMKVRSIDGGVEGGRYYDFHIDGTSGDYDVRIDASSYGNNRFLGFSCYGQSASHLMDLYAGNFQINDKSGPGNWSLILNSDHLTSVDTLFGASDKSYLVATLFDNFGGARLKGHYHNGVNRSAPALLLEGVKNDDGQIDTEVASVQVNAYSLTTYNGSVIGTGSNTNNNIFGVSNCSVAKMVVKGDGRVLAPDCTPAMISNNSSNRILTTREYIQSILEGGDMIPLPGLAGGYKKINGIMFQWLRIDKQVNNFNGNYFLPVAFSTKILGCIADYALVSNASYVLRVRYDNTSLNMINLFEDRLASTTTGNGANAVVYVLAWGY